MAVDSQPARRPSPLRRSWAHGLVAPTTLGLVAGIVGGRLTGSVGLHKDSQALGDWAALLASVAIVAPIHEGLKLAAFLPPHRGRSTDDRLTVSRKAAALGLGYGIAAVALHWASTRLSALSLARGLLLLPVHLFAPAVWAFALARSRSLGLPAGRTTVLAWGLAVAVHGLYAHLLHAPGWAGVLTALPLLAAMAVAVAFGIRALTNSSLFPPSSRAHKLLPPPPSLRAMRAALRRAERPATLRWIVLGALVTIGAMLVSVVATILLAHRLGIEFGALDDGDIRSTLPLVSLGVAVLVAFPFAGYLMARASATGSILEPAMGAGLAIVSILVGLGLASPITVVFGLAFAPVAFVLACTGAWMGVSFSER